MRARYPNVLFENCSSGAMRMDYNTMSRFSIAATSDQTDYRLYPYIAANILAAAIPEQAAVWSYPVGTSVYPADNPFTATEEWVNKNVSDTQVAMNMVNSLLGRMHLASHLELLNDSKTSLVKEGVAVYNSIKEFKKRALPAFPLGFADFRSEFVSAGLKDGNKTLFAAWNLKPGNKREIPCKGLISARIIYPSASKVKLNCGAAGIELYFGGEPGACFIETITE